MFDKLTPVHLKIKKSATAILVKEIGCGNDKFNKIFSWFQQIVLRILPEGNNNSLISHYEYPVICLIPDK